MNNVLNQFKLEIGQWENERDTLKTRCSEQERNLLDLQSNNHRLFHDLHRLNELICTNVSKEVYHTFAQQKVIWKSSMVIYHLNFLVFSLDFTGSLVQEECLVSICSRFLLDVSVKMRDYFTKLLDLLACFLFGDEISVGLPLIWGLSLRF